MDHPRAMNLGSGKDFRSDHLNLDVDPLWSPDVVCDLSRPLFEDGEPEYETARFGRVRLARGAYEKLVANDVLEHVPDLVTTMTNALELLGAGGTFEIQVPYDLSYGAWQDPTHVRAFNERSWVYYTDWFWYLGWTEARFQVATLNMEPSPIGRELLANGIPQDAVLRTPRAIDSMKVVLRKTALSSEDLRAVESLAKRREALACR